jgi:hypothetical protein
MKFGQGLTSLCQKLWKGTLRISAFKLLRFSKKIKSELCSKEEERHGSKSQIRSERKHFSIFYEYCSILVYPSIEDFEYCNTSIEILQYYGHPNF